MEKSSCSILIYKDDILFPNTSQVIDVDGVINVAALTNVVLEKQKFVVAFPNKKSDDISAEDIYPCAVLVDMNKITRVNSSGFKLNIDVLELVELSDIILDNHCYKGKYSFITEPKSLTLEVLQPYKDYVLMRIAQIIILIKKSVPKYVLTAMESTTKSNEFVNLASTILVNSDSKYQLLAERDEVARIELLSVLVEKMRVEAELIDNIESRVNDRLRKTNNDYFLREQIKEMEKEINPLGGQNTMISDYRDKLIALKLSVDNNAKIDSEIDRLSRMNETAPEHSILRSYLDIVLNLPWNKIGEDNKDIVNAMEILDADHYGIKEVKDRIIEYLAVRLLTEGKNRGGAICLLGPPGVGKTSVARSIARALNKEYVQLTLGGVHDEAEIRGHRKTYIGAMPGRIISALSKAKTNNPVFLLDEVDKITRDMRGDPQSALLEVLDPNQNTEFRDNFIEVPYDLSKVMFILTANDLSSVDKPLLDRMEVIEMDGYTVEEKIAIASKYLIAKQTKEHGLQEDQLVLTNELIREIIEGYTNESGVRDLERKIAAICRKIAIKIVQSGAKDSIYNLTYDDLKEFLGVRRSSIVEQEVSSEVGRVCGLAWTATGGVTLHIEVAIIKGSGEFKITGNLGDVMKESATLAMSIARKKAITRGIDPDFFKNHDIHIHVPMGAVPKDGPSAGVTISTAILSAILNCKIRSGIAMTGEVSLSGRVHAIGGLKGKSLAAHRAGVKQIIIPRENQRDIDKLPDSVKADIEFILADNIEDVFRHAVVEYGD